jgi:hypothetical protein
LYSVSALSASDVWVASQHNPVIEHWNGTRWIAVNGAPAAFALDTVSDTDVWAVGPNGVADWDGSHWTPVPVAVAGPSMAFLSVFAVTANDIWIGGDYLSGSTSEGVIEHWDGSAWTQVPAPSVGPVSAISGASADDVWAVAATNSPSAGSALLHWDGSTWTTVATTQGSVLQAVTEVSPTDVWVAGNPNSLSAPDVIGNWNGQALSMTAIAGGAEMNGIAAVSASDVWAVGYLGNGGSAQTLVEHWDGANWTQITSPNISPTYNQLFGLSAAPDGSIWAVGRYGGSFLHPLVQGICPG